MSSFFLLINRGLLSNVDLLQRSSCKVEIKRGKGSWKKHETFRTIWTLKGFSDFMYT